MPDHSHKWAVVIASFCSSVIALQHKMKHLPCYTLTEKSVANISMEQFVCRLRTREVFTEQGRDFKLLKTFLLCMWNGLDIQETHT
ncbi:hypothetical protein HOLleu_32675 [Holothuria leucospilota]|uniref:Secreted protein n=1 Tax=Holothuria leucospilota TaxID=206669 RepID=A0A9Q1BJ58_HOLLE|nr:hypothetical protein HOLleu_32675 [Holothuria leucospilota]